MTLYAEGMDSQAYPTDVSDEEWRVAARWDTPYSACHNQVASEASDHAAPGSGQTSALQHTVVNETANVWVYDAVFGKWRGGPKDRI